MKKLYGAKIGLLFVSLALVLSIFAFSLINKSVAWFVFNNSVSANGFSVKIDGKYSKSATVKSYPVLNIDEDTGAYTADLTTEIYALPVHDDKKIAPNQYREALVIEINLHSADPGSVTVSVSASGDAATILTKENYISNCLRIRPASISDSVVTIDSDALTQVNFVDISGDNVVKHQSIELCTVNVSSGDNKIYFVMDYDLDLLQYISDKMLVLDPTVDIVNFSNDIEFIIQ